MPANPRYCDVSLPVPLDQPFTYCCPKPCAIACSRVPGAGSVRHAQPDRCGLEAPTTILPPRRRAKPCACWMKSPRWTPDSCKLGRWISEYYCAPLGETLRAMTPLAGDVRRGKIYSLTTAGHDAARQFHLGDNRQTIPACEILRHAGRPPAVGVIPRAESRESRVRADVARKEGMGRSRGSRPERDPLRASAARLRVEFAARGEQKLPKAGARAAGVSGTASRPAQPRRARRCRRQSQHRGPSLGAAQAGDA